MNTVLCQEVSKRYRQNVALNNLNVEIPENHIVGVLGPNGAGKSTFFQMLVGLVRPDSGTVQVLGKTPGWKINDQIAYLPDRARWYGDYTVEQSLQYGKNFLPGFELEKALKLTEDMKLDAKMLTRDMSMGQEALLMLTLCMARDVSLVVLDEPFSGIDLIAKERIMEVIIDLASGREQTILISTHEIAETEGLFDYTVFFKEGEVVLASEVEELRREQGSLQSVYRNLYR